MPSGMQTIDAGLPRFTGQESTEARVEAIQNYLYMLLEELQYVLRNLGKENLNPESLSDIKTEITNDVAVRLRDGDRTAELAVDIAGIHQRVTDAEGNISTLEQTAEGLEARVQNAEGDISTLEQTAEGIRAQVTDEAGNYTVLNLRSDGLHVGDASGTTTIAGSSVEAGSLRLTDNLSFNAVSSTATGAAGTAASADALAKALAGGTPIAATVGTFINGRNIYSPNIYTNQLTIQPPQATAQWSGGLDLKGYYGSRLFDMFRMSYYQGDGPAVQLESPDGAILALDFPDILITGGDVYSYGDIRAARFMTGAYGTAAPSGTAEGGQLYFQIVG